MAKHVLLNNVDHKDLRVLTDRSEAFGDNVNCALVYPLEFRSLQAHYPIFFQKDAGSDQFRAVALLGFAQQENLFLKKGQWEANYVPLSMDRGPFLIGFEGTSGEQQPVVHINLDDPRVNEADGERLFLPQGGNAPYLEKIAANLDTTHQAHQATQSFLDVLVEMDLLESFTLDIELNDGSNNRLAGFYTLNEDKLNALMPDQLGKLHERGYLQAIFMVAASLSNIRELVDRKNITLTKT